MLCRRARLRTSGMYCWINRSRELRFPSSWYSRSSLRTVSRLAEAGRRLPPERSPSNPVRRGVGRPGRSSSAAITDTALPRPPRGWCISRFRCPTITLVFLFFNSELFLFSRFVLHVRGYLRVVGSSVAGVTRYTVEKNVELILGRAPP